VNSVDHMKIASLELFNYFIDELLPLLGKIVFADDLNGITELL
jgi:hypothetical protein